MNFLQHFSLQCPTLSVSPSPLNNIFSPQSQYYLTQSINLSLYLSQLVFLRLHWYDLYLIYPAAVSSAYIVFFFLLSNTSCVYGETMNPSVHQLYSWLLYSCFLLYLLLLFKTYLLTIRYVQDSLLSISFPGVPSV